MSIKGYGHHSPSKKQENSSSTSNVTSSLANNPKENYAKSLYIEIVLDVCGGKTSIESLEKFRTILDWLLSGMISEEEFDMLFLQWAKQSALTITDLKENLASSSPQKRYNLIESEWNKFFIENYSDYQLDVLMGMLINFQNKDLKFQWQCTEDWLRSVEHLFFLLDDENKSLLSLEEILVLVIVIASDYAKNGQSITPEFVLNQAFEVMDDAGAFKGAITLRRFKQYFNTNSLDRKAIESSVSLLSESPSVNNILSNSILVNFEESAESPFVIPKLWREAVLDTKKVYSNSEDYDHFTDDVMRFLLKEALVHKQSLKNTSLGFEGALHLFFAFSKKTLLEKQYSTEEIKKEPLFEIFEKTLGKFHSLIKHTVNTYAHKEGTVDSSTMTNSEDDSLIREQMTTMIESTCIEEEEDITQNSTPEKVEASPEQFKEPTPESPLELSPPPIEDMKPVIPLESNVQQEEASEIVVTPTKGLHKKELEKIGALNIKLPFDIDRMLRNAEWIDIKPSNLMQFPYLPKTGKGAYFESFLRNEARRSILTESTQDSGDKPIEKIIEEKILETEEMLSTNYTNQDVRKSTIAHEEKKSEPSKEPPETNEFLIEDVATPIKSTTLKHREEDFFTEKEIEEEVEKFFTLNNIPNYNESITQDSEEETLMFHKLLKKQRAESSKNLNYNMGSPELDKNDLSTPTKKSSPELLSQPKEYEPDIIFINEEDSLFISPTIPKRLEKAFRGSFQPSPRAVAFAPHQSQFVATPKVLNKNNAKKNKTYQPILNNPSIPTKKTESPRQSLNTILSTALRDSSAILKETEVNNYSPSKAISVKLTDFIDDKSRKASSSSKNINAVKKNNNITSSVSNSRPPSRVITQKPRVVEDTLINDAKRPKPSERKK